MKKASVRNVFVGWNVMGIGIDLVENERMRKTLRRCRSGQDEPSR